MADMDRIIVEPTGGLCNRLRVVFSYIGLSAKESKVLEVVWRKNRDCDGFFLDFFEDVPGAVFVDSPSGDIFYKGCYPLGVPDYGNLRLRPTMEKRVRERIDSIGGKYLAAHIRRTDHVELAKSKGLFTGDEVFADFFEKNEGKIFIATDNPETQAKFKNIYKDRLFIFSHIEESADHRMTSLEDAVLDIYTCANSSEFIGTRYSSFSDFIKILRS